MGGGDEIEGRGGEGRGAIILLGEGKGIRERGGQS